MPKKTPSVPEIPDISEELDRYEELNPVSGVRDELKKLAETCLNENNEMQPTKEIVQRIECIRIRLKAVIPQLEANGVWMGLLATANEEKTADDSRPARVACSEEEFKASPRTFYKTIQEILTSPSERLAFQREEDSDEVIDMSNIVIDPEKINDTLLDNLGLSKYKPSEKYKPKKRFSKPEKLAAYAEAIPEIKEMLRNLDPFKLSHERQRSRLHFFRLMRIGSGPNEGYLLGTQQIGDKKFLFKTDLHGSYRRIRHINKGYTAEIDLLIRIEDGIKDIDRRVAKDWAGLRDSGELTELSGKLLEMVEKLQYVSNAHKVKIRELIRACVTFKSTVHRPGRIGVNADGTRSVKREAETREVYNPGAARARWNTVRDYVGKRINEIAQIKSYLAKDEARIEQYISAQEAPFDRHYEKVERMHDRFKVFDYEKPITKKDADVMISALADIQEECQPLSRQFGHMAVVFEPYLSFAERMAAHIDKTIKMLSDSFGPGGEPLEREAFAAEFLKIYLVAKVQYFYHDLQKFYADFLSPEKMPYFNHVLAELKGLWTLIKDKRVGKGKDSEPIKTPEFNKVFGKIYTLLRELKKQAIEAREAMKTKDTDTASKLKEKMREKVRGFSFEGLMRNDGAAEAGKEGTNEKDSTKKTGDLPFDPPV